MGKNMCIEPLLPTHPPIMLHITWEIKPVTQKGKPVQHHWSPRGEEGRDHTQLVAGVPIEGWRGETTLSW